MPKARKPLTASASRIIEGAAPAEALDAGFPRLNLPIQPPFPPMEAKLVETIPTGDAWQYEPKWDGFRCLAFRDAGEVALQSKAGQPLARYFPELVEALRTFNREQFVLDGEIVIVRDGHLSFDDLLMRIHPAKSRIEKLSVATPCTLMAFDLLADADGALLTERPLSERRARLEKFYDSGDSALLRLSPATPDIAVARRWITELTESGFDGVVAKELNEPYLSGERAMRKIKRIRTADCVVGGFRLASKGGGVGSLLLGLYGHDGLLHHVGFTSSFNYEQRAELLKILKPYRGGRGFTGNAPGGPSRWSTERSAEWEPLHAKLVVEVSYDHFSGGRFRHGTKFLRWRPEKRPEACTMEQLPAADAHSSVESLLAS